MIYVVTSSEKFKFFHFLNIWFYFWNLNIVTAFSLFSFCLQYLPMHSFCSLLNYGLYFFNCCFSHTHTHSCSQIYKYKVFCPNDITCMNITLQLLVPKAQGLCGRRSREIVRARERENLLWDLCPLGMSERPMNSCQCGCLSKIWIRTAPKDILRWRGTYQGLSTLDSELQVMMECLLGGGGD